MKNIQEMVKELGLKEKTEKSKEVKKPVKVIIYQLKDKDEFIELLGKKYQTYYENNIGYYWKRKYEIIGNEVRQTYYEDSDFWSRREYELIGNEVKQTYYEDSNGYKKWYDGKDKLELNYGVYCLNDKEMEK